ncbi:MAG: response regulator transcription factor [Acidobacteria bacterium]|nr:response regulator transcription factor [Acidobacteriota bacterium]
MPKIRVLLVDDHALVRRGFRRLLEDDPEIEVAGEASDGAQGEELALQLKPDVIVLDYALPGQNGALTARKILALQPGAKILILSMHSEPAYVAQSREAGASGYLLKNALDLELVEAVKAVRAGGWVQDPRLAQAASETTGKRQLTTRELEVLQHIVAGRSNKEIAATLQLSVNTVAVHRANIMDALAVHNTADLVVYAIRHGLAGMP